jgi:hypothetical protein
MLDGMHSQFRDCFWGILQAKDFIIIVFTMIFYMERYELIQCNKTSEFVESDRPLIQTPFSSPYITTKYSVKTFNISTNSKIANEIPIECPICHEEFKIIVKPGRIKTKEEAEKELRKVKSNGWIMIVCGIILIPGSIIYIIPIIFPLFTLFSFVLPVIGLGLISLGYENAKQDITDVNFENDMITIVGKDNNNNHLFYNGMRGSIYKEYHP